MKLTNKDLRRIIKEELTNVLQEKGSTANAANKTIEALELMDALASSSLSPRILFSHPEGHANPSAKPSSTKEAVETITMHADGLDPEFLEIIGQPRFSRAHFWGVAHLDDLVDDTISSLPQEERSGFFLNSPKGVVIDFIVPNPFDRGGTASGVPSIKIIIYTGKDGSIPTKELVFEGRALMHDSNLYNAIGYFQNIWNEEEKEKNRFFLWDWANQQLQGF